MTSRSRFAGLALALLTLSAAPALAAAPDNNVEWAGISHLPSFDRRPLCPINGESFQVRFQSWHNDLTGASVHVTDGVTTTDAPAAIVGRRGPYDVWAAQVPATAASSESYWIALTDGTDTDYYGPSGMSSTPPASGFPLDFTTLVHAPAGATPTSNGGAVFKVWAPNAGVTSAAVRGAFNGWTSTALTQVGEYWIGRYNSVADRAEYKFYFPTQPNNSHYCPDPYARGFSNNGPYNGTVENPFRFTWTDSAFVTPSTDSLVIYQLHVGTFCGLNDPVGATSFPSGYLDVAARVGHLKDLGVNCVMLNPITEFPGDLSAGYNPITAWAPEWKYGSPDNFKTLVNTLHANGIAVLLDIVWNHMSPTDNFMWMYDGYQEWFETPDQQTQWGSQCAFGKQGVADYYANSAQYWFSEFHVDGFRMDATSAMTVGVHSSSGLSLMQRLNNEKANRWADKITIAEQLPSNSSYTTPTSSGGAGFDAQYDGLWRDNVRGAIFDAASGDPNMNNVRSALIGSGTYLSGTHVVNYIQLHDEAWPSSGGQRMVKTIDTTAPYDDIYAQGRTKLGEGMTILSQGIPAILMGDEFLESNDFGADTPNRIDWSKLTTYAPIYHYYQRLYYLRRALAPLRASASIYVSHVNESANVIAFRRYDASGNSIMVIANFSNNDYTGYRFGVPASGNWEELVNSQDAQYGGSGPVDPNPLTPDPTFYDGYAQSLSITLPKMALIVLGPMSYVSAPAPAAATRLRLSAPWPNPTSGSVQVEFELPAATQGTLTVHDVAGRVVATLASGALGAGPHTLQWSGTDAAGRPAAPGLYFARLRTTLGNASARVAVAR
jgi:1,4-alpha-glucan branching enzyme